MEYSSEEEQEDEDQTPVACLGARLQTVRRDCAGLLVDFLEALFLTVCARARRRGAGAERRKASFCGMLYWQPKEPSFGRYFGRARRRLLKWLEAQVLREFEVLLGEAREGGAERAQVTVALFRGSLTRWEEIGDSAAVVENLRDALMDTFLELTSSALPVRRARDGRAWTAGIRCRLLPEAELDRDEQCWRKDLQVLSGGPRQLNEAFLRKSSEFVEVSEAECFLMTCSAGRPLLHHVMNN